MARRKSFVERPCRMALWKLPVKTKLDVSLGTLKNWERRKPNMRFWPSI
jgi:hypothetical protein